MKLLPLSAFALAAVTSALMVTTASAGMVDYNQLEQSVRAGLESLHVPTDHLGQLTMDEVAKLSGILDSTDSNADKAQAANEVIDQAIHPQVISMTSPQGQALMTSLKSELTRIGLKHENLDKLSADQVQAVLDAISHHKKDDERARQAAEAIFADFDRPANVTTANAGVVQLEKQIDSQLETLGIAKPDPAKLTLDQISQLADIFDKGGDQAAQKAAAMKVLGL